MLGIYTSPTIISTMANTDRILVNLVIIEPNEFIFNNLMPNYGVILTNYNLDMEFTH